MTTAYINVNRFSLSADRSKDSISRKLTKTHLGIMSPGDNQNEVLSGDNEASINGTTESPEHENADYYTNRSKHNSGWRHLVRNFTPA